MPESAAQASKEPSSQPRELWSSPSRPAARPPRCGGGLRTNVCPATALETQRADLDHELPPQRPRKVAVAGRRQQERAWSADDMGAVPLLQARALLRQRRRPQPVAGRPVGSRPDHVVLARHQDRQAVDRCPGGEQACMRLREAVGAVGADGGCRPRRRRPRRARRRGQQAGSTPAVTVRNIWPRQVNWPARRGVRADQGCRGRRVVPADDPPPADREVGLVGPGHHGEQDAAGIAGDGTDDGGILQGLGDTLHLEPEAGGRRRIATRPPSTFREARWRRCPARRRLAPTRAAGGRRIAAARSGVQPNPVGIIGIGTPGTRGSRKPVGHVSGRCETGLWGARRSGRGAVGTIRRGGGRVAIGLEARPR